MHRSKSFIFLFITTICLILVGASIAVWKTNTDRYQYKHYRPTKNTIVKAEMSLYAWDSLFTVIDRQATRLYKLNANNDPLNNINERQLALDSLHIALTSIVTNITDTTRNPVLARK